MLKKELIAECERLNLEWRGTKADLSERLENESKNEYDYEVIELSGDPTKPIPKGRDIFYRCTVCEAKVPSVPTAGEAICECKYFNICVSMIDFKIMIVDPSKVEFLRRVLKT